MVNHMIFYTLDAVPDDFDLPTRHALSAIYLGWRVEAGHVDGGPSEPIARVLAAALCQQCHATFLCTLADQASPQWQRQLGYFAQEQTRLLKPKLPLIWTQEPALVMQAFDTDWTTQGQFILLSSSAAPVDFAAHDLQGKPAAILEFIQHTADFCGAMLPGVDGDVAGVYFRDDHLRDMFLTQALASAARDAGMDIQQHSAATFTTGEMLPR